MEEVKPMVTQPHLRIITNGNKTKSMARVLNCKRDGLPPGAV
jgi:hypothetical protein